MITDKRLAELEAQARASASGITGAEVLELVAVYRRVRPLELFRKDNDVSESAAFLDGFAGAFVGVLAEKKLKPCPEPTPAPAPTRPRRQAMREGLTPTDREAAGLDLGKFLRGGRAAREAVDQALEKHKRTRKGSKK